MPLKLGQHELEYNFYVPLDPKNNKIICPQRQKNHFELSELQKFQGLDNFYKVNGVFLTKNNRFFPEWQVQGLT